MKVWRCENINKEKNVNHILAKNWFGDLVCCCGGRVEEMELPSKERDGCHSDPSSCPTG